MKYTLFSLDDTRDKYKYNLHRELGGMGWKQCVNHNVNGSIPHILQHQIEEHGYDINCYIKVGQLGIWYTVLNSFRNAPHVTFEDDAVLGSNFNLNWHFRSREIPPDFDFFSLFNARNCDDMYTPDLDVSKYLCRVYPRYGGVSMYYSQTGVEKIKALLARDGITGQYDDTLYAYAKAGELNGYISKPKYSNLVTIAPVPSIVQNSKEYDARFNQRK